NLRCLEMAPWTAKEQSSGAHAQELSDLLTPEQRIELPLFVAKIAEVMRKHVADTFDASMTSKTPQQALKGRRNPNIDDSKTHKETDEEKKTRKLMERREKGLSEPKMQDLKKANLEYLRLWQKSVIDRVEEVLKPKETTTAPQLPNEVEMEA